MEAILFVGIQGAGKSSFYEQRFATSHFRINMDTLKTRHREMALLRSCLESGKNIVVDNTNATAEVRHRYIAPAKSAGYRIIGYFFDCSISDCLKRNSQRSGKGRVPDVALFGTLKRMVRPSFEEGFDALFYVELTSTGQFQVMEWTEVPADKFGPLWPPRKSESSSVN